jgi:hypothetical protein
MRSTITPLLYLYKLFMTQETSCHAEGVPCRFLFWDNASRNCKSLKEFVREVEA